MRFLVFVVITAAAACELDPGPGGLGAGCSGAGDCVSDLICRYGSCEVPDGTCSVSQHCSGGAFCRAGFCCGDGSCDDGETCSLDCGGTQAATCGDGQCAATESCGSCASDCGACPRRTPAGQGRVLPIQPIPQYTQVWCWAATSEMVLNWFGFPSPQCQIVSYWTGLPCCPVGNGVPGCYTGAPTMQAIEAAIEVGGVPTLHVPSALSFDEVSQHLDAGRPLIIGYQGSFSGHVVVVHGYDPGGNLYIHDPYYGSFVVPYTTAGLYAGAQIWAHTLVVGY